MVLESPDSTSKKEAVLFPESFCQAAYAVPLHGQHILHRSLSLFQRYLKLLSLTVSDTLLAFSFTAEMFFLMKA